jgi:hypothetical protein
MQTNTAPPPWDQSWYLQTSEDLFYALQEHGLPGFLGTLSHAFGGMKAPLISLLPLPFYFTIGHGKDSIIAINLALIVIFCFIFFRLVRELAGPWPALVAVMISSTMPLTIGLSRQFLVEYGLMTLVTGWLFFQWRSDYFRSLSHKIILGIILGLGLLMKASFPLFIAGPVMLGLYRRWQEEKFILKKWVYDFALIGLIGAAIASIWYLPNALRVAKFAFSAGFGSLATDYSFGIPWAWETLSRFWQIIINLGISTYYGALLLAMLALWVIQSLLSRVLRRELSATRHSYKQDSVIFLLLWFVIPFLVLSLGVNKDYRFILPALPALGALLVLLLFRVVPSGLWRGFLLSATLAFPIFMFCHFTFPDMQKLYWANRSWIWLTSSLGYTTRPIQEKWPQIEIISTILSDAQKTGPLPGPLHKPRTLLVVDHRFFNQNNFSYYAAFLNTPLIFSAVNARSQEEWPARREYLLQSQYALTKESGDQGAPFNSVMNPEIRKMLASGELPFVEVARFELPDGSESILYRKK